MFYPEQNYNDYLLQLTHACDAIHSDVADWIGFNGYWRGATGRWSLLVLHLQPGTGHAVPRGARYVSLPDKQCRQDMGRITV